MSAQQPQLLQTASNVTNITIPANNGVTLSIPSSIPLSLQISLGLIKPARRNVAIFNKRIREKQRFLFEGYFRGSIQPHLHSISVPVDIYNLCFRFFELNLVSMLHSDPEIRSKLTVSDSHSHHSPNPPLPNHLTEKEMMAFARCLRDRREYHVAISLIQWLISANPKSAHLHNAIATIFQRWNMYPEAENAYHRAIELDPNTNAFRYNLGLLLEKEEKYQLALNQFRSASATESKEAEYIFESAYCFQRLHDLENATSLYQQAMKMRPERAIYYEYYALYLCQEFDDLSTATIYFEKSIELEPTRWQIHYSYARCLRDYFKDYVKAKEVYLKSLELNPNKGFTYGSYGYLLYLMADYHAARECIDRAMALDPERPFTLYYNSLLLKTMGKDVEADKALTMAVDAACIPKAVLRILKRMKRDNPRDSEMHQRFEVLLRVKASSMNGEPDEDLEGESGHNAVDSE